MAACCPLSGGGDYDDYGPSFFVEEYRRAAKPHVCCECDGAIPVGSRYENTSGKWDGYMRTYKTCMVCCEIRNHFGARQEPDEDGFRCTGGWTYEALWDQLAQNFFPRMTAGGPCFVGLSPQAKHMLFEKRMAWLVKYPKFAHPKALYNPRKAAHASLPSSFGHPG